MPMKAWKAYGIMAGLTVTTGLFGLLYGKEKLYDHWDAKYLQPKSKISLAIGDNVNFRSDIKTTPEGKYSGKVELEAPASVMEIQTPSPRGKPQSSDVVPSGTVPTRERPIRGEYDVQPPKPPQPKRIVPGKYQVIDVKYDGGEDPLCGNDLPGWIKVYVDGEGEDIAIPCKHFTPDQARAAAKGIAANGIIEVMEEPTDRYRTRKGEYWAVVPMSRLENDKVEDYPVGN